MKNAVFIIVLLFLTTSPASANIVINEIYPAPAENEEEWVELYNNSDQPVDLTGYSVTDELDKKLILQDMNVSSHGYVLATSNKILNNSGDTVKIKKDDQLIDEYTYGSHGSNYSSARCPDGSGEFQKVTTQTKALSNQPVCDALTPTLIPQPTPTTHPSDQPGNDYNNIYLSEAYVYPASEESEWVELYNDNDFEAKLTNWYLDDLKDAGSAPKKFTVTIPAKSYAVVELSSYLNNSGDSVRLLNAEKEEKDSFSYSQAKKSLSFGKNPGGSACLQNPTRAASNSDCMAPDSDKEIEANDSPALTETSDKKEKQNASKKPTISPTVKLVYVDQLSARQIKDTPVANSEVLGASLEAEDKDENQPDPNTAIITQGFASSSYLFSSLNIFYIIGKLYKRKSKNHA